MRTRILLLFTAIVTVASAQNATLAKLFDGTYWTDGTTVYYAQQDGNFVNMSGGTLHEGGYAFGLQCTDTKDLYFTLQAGTFNGTEAGDAYISLPCKKGAEVETRQLGGDTYLLVNDKELMPVYSLRLMKEDEDLRTVIIDGMVQNWVGKYSVTYSDIAQCPVGTDCAITSDRISLGKYASGAFQVMEEFETPSNIVKLANGMYVMIKPCGKAGQLRYGLSLYTVSYDAENDVFGDERLIMVLDRKPGTSPRWRTDTRVLLPGEISEHPRTELRVVRNEIFARHGFRFSSADLAGYFKSEPWYEMDSDPNVNNKIHFSAIESINISLLRAAENNEDYYFPPLDEDALNRRPAAGDNSLYRITPWEERRSMTVHDYDEIEIMDYAVTPYDINADRSVTYEWCKAEGTDFKVGLSHKRHPGGEIKSIVIRKNGTDKAYPMLRIGDEEPLPETTIRVAGNYLWFELKYASKTRYYFYNLKTHVPSRSDRNAYLNRKAPADADETWEEITSSHLSPKAY